MRRLFIDQGKKFFQERLGVTISGKGHLEKLEERIEKVNIKKSKIINLLPSEDLMMVLSNPCFVRIWPKMK